MGEQLRKQPALYVVGTMQYYVQPQEIMCDLGQPDCFVAFFNNINFIIILWIKKHVASGEVSSPVGHWNILGYLIRKRVSVINSKRTQCISTQPKPSRLEIRSYFHCMRKKSKLC